MLARPAPAANRACSEQLADGEAEDAQRPLVLQALRRLVQLLQGQLRVPVEFLIVDEFAHGALALINLLQNLLQVGHGLGGLPVERFILHQFPDRALAGVDLIHDLARVGDRRLYLGSRILQVADRGEGGVVERFILDEFAQRAFALRNLGGEIGGDRLHVGDRGRERVFVGV